MIKWTSEISNKFLKLKIFDAVLLGSKNVKTNYFSSTFNEIESRIEKKRPTPLIPNPHFTLPYVTKLI